MLRFLLSLSCLLFCFSLQAQYQKVHTFKNNVRYLEDFQSTSHLIEVDKSKGRVNWYRDTDFSLYLSVDLYIPSGYTLDSLYSHDYILDTSSGAKFGYVVKSGLGNSIGIICNEKGKLIKQFPDCVSMKILPGYYRYKLAVVKLKGGAYTTDVCRLDSNYHVEKTYPTSNLQRGHTYQKNYFDTLYFRYYYVNTTTKKVVVHGLKHQRIRAIPITVPTGATLRTTVHHFYEYEINSDYALEFGVYFVKNGVYSAKIINHLYEVQSFSNASSLTYYALDNDKKALAVSSKPVTIAKREIFKIDDTKTKNTASSWFSVNGRFSFSEYYQQGIGIDIDSMTMFHYGYEMRKVRQYTVDLGLSKTDEILASTGYYQGSSDGDGRNYEAYYLWKSNTGKYTFNIKNNDGVQLLKVNNARRFDVNNRYINNKKSQFSLLVPGSGVEIYEYDFSIKQPVRIAPTHKSKQQDFEKLTFSWNKTKNAIRYTLTLFTDTNDQNTGIGSPYIDDTTYTMENILDSATVYFWKVTAYNSETSRSNYTFHRFKTFDAGDIATPTLISPTDASKDLNLSLRLTWSKVNGADGYEFQYSETPAFATSTQGNVTTAYADISGLKNDQNYFWRVRAKKGVALSDWSSSWYFTTAKKSTLSSPLLLSPASGTSNTGNAPTITWQAVTGATTYTYEYGQKSDFSDGTSKNTTGITASLSALDYDATYYWRVKASDGTEVSAWSSVWSFGTGAKSNVATPTLLSPSNGASNTGNTPTLIWQAVTGATTYTYEYGQKSDFSDGTSKNTTGLTAFLSALDYDATYYWRVRASDGTEVSAWSTAWSFGTGAKSNVATPTLLSPGNGTSNTGNTPTLIWQAVTGATAYTYEYGQKSDFSDGTSKNATGTTTSLSALDYDATYYWRVRASDGTEVSAWSTTWSFGTGAKSNVASPTLLSPSNGASNQSTTPTLSWDVVTDATDYTYEYATLADFSNATSGTSSSTSTQLSSLSSEQVYYWRVKAEKSGDFSHWSATWSFETAKAGIPEKPVLTLPANNSKDIDPNNVTLEWNAANNAVSYEIQLSTDLNFVTFSTGTPSGLSITFTDLKEETVYYWRVKSINGANESDWSDIWIFTTDKAESIGGLYAQTIESYPNPVTNLLHIEWSGTTDETQHIRLFNTTGQLLTDQMVNTSTYQLDMTDLQAGVYWLQISNGEEQVLKKVIKR